MSKRVSISAIAASVLFTAQSQAIEFDGFLTAGLAVHDQDSVLVPDPADPTNNPPVEAAGVYLDGITQDISFDNDSKFGIQVTADASPDMQVVAQLLAAGADNNYSMDVEWAYLDYAISDNFSLRGGKVKQPVFLISDYFEVGYAYPWIRPPQEVYRNNPINTIVGMEALYQLNFSELSITFQPYLGTNSDAVPGSGGAVTFNAENLAGLAIMANTRSFTFQMSYLQTDVETISPANAASAAVGDATLGSIGLSWDIYNFVGYTEYVTRDINNAVGNPMEKLFPDQDAYYLTLGYRMGKYLPHITVANSESTPFAGGGGNPGVNQDSITLGLRYELNQVAALKMEVQSIEPSEAAQAGLFNGSLINTNKANMLSIAVDVIF